MALSDGVRTARRSARRTRLVIFAQVAFATVLATAAVVLATWLAEQRGFRLRGDLTKSGENTLDPKSIAVIEKLPDDVKIDVFFRRAEPPIHLVSAVAQDRMRKLLRRAKDESKGRIEVEEHDLSDVANLGARLLGRKAELGVLDIEPGGLFVVSAGARREVVRLRPHIADIDPGNNDRTQGPPVQPRIVNFLGEDALMSALLKVTQGTAKKVLFTQGHGERPIDGVDQEGLSGLKSQLEADGFEVGAWDSTRTGGMPEDCNLLAIIGPEQSFTPSEVATIRAFVESGGHLIAAPGERPVEGEGSLAALLAEFGVKVRPRGVVAVPLRTPSGGLQYELEECSHLVIDGRGMAASHPITETLRRADRRVYLLRSKVLERGTTPPGGILLELLRSPDESWHELPRPDTEDSYDWRPSDDAQRGRFTVAMQSVFALRRPPSPQAVGDGTTRPQSRVVVVGTKWAFVNAFVPDNRDFLLNTFNWLEGREYRVKVSRVDPQARRLDLAKPGVLSRVHTVAVILLPLSCALLGLLTAWARKRR
jgi:hypothetical protein